jgi:NAD-dependent dihydropyrimidine dehydrogenase PreA subunit
MPYAAGARAFIREAKGDCVEVCPYDVFEVGPIDEKDSRALGWFGSVRVHGIRTAYTPPIAVSPATCAWSPAPKKRSNLSRSTLRRAKGSARSAHQERIVAGASSLH